MGKIKRSPDMVEHVVREAMSHIKRYVQAPGASPA